MTYISTKLNLFKTDSMYRNAFWLMAGTVVMSAVGLFYWIIAARIYTPSQIGLGVTLLSVLSLILSLSLLGFNTTLIRFLSNSKLKQQFINTSFTSIALASIIFGIFYIILMPFITKDLSFIRESFIPLLLILILFPLNSLNGITDSVFIALREAKFVFISNITQSISKLFFLILLSSFGIWGIIGSLYLSIIIAVTLCLIIIVKRYHITLRVELHQKIIKEVRRYTFANYVISFIGSVPTYVLPIIITNNISPSATAYFYMPNMISTLLTVFPTTIARSYFTESSHKGFIVSMKKPLLITYAILIPIVLVLCLFGQYILSLFGKSYAAEGYIYLVLVCLSIIVSLPCHFLGARLLIKQRMKTLVFMNIFGVVTGLFLYFICSRFGVAGIGIAAFISQTIAVITYVLDYIINK